MSNQLRAEVLTHEMIHSVTAYANYWYKHDPSRLPEHLREAAEELDNLYQEAVWNNPRAYELPSYCKKSVDEFVAEGNSNPEVRTVLKKMGIWTKFVNAIKRFFMPAKKEAAESAGVTGFEQSSAYNEMSKILDKFLNNFDVDSYKAFVGISGFGLERYNFEVGGRGNDTLFRIEDELPVVEITDKAEWETLNHAIHTHNNFKKGEVNDEFTANNYYLYTHKGDGRFDVNFQIPIDGNEDLIGTLKKIVRNGTIRSAADIAGIVKDDWADRATDNYINADAQGRRDGDEGSVLRYRETGQNQGGRVANMASKLSQGASSKGQQIVSDHITKVAKKLGAEVRQVNSIEEVTNPEARKALEAGKKVTGWFDEATGKVELYLPNITDRYTAEKTVWHETVGHKGLEGLLGGSFREDSFIVCGKTRATLPCSST